MNHTFATCYLMKAMAVLLHGLLPFHIFTTPIPKFEGFLNVLNGHRFHAVHEAHLTRPYVHIY